MQGLLYHQVNQDVRDNQRRDESTRELGSAIDSVVSGLDLEIDKFHKENTGYADSSKYK